jgi:hypothetical protein
VRFGKPLMIENVEEWIDPIMSPILLKKIYRKGNQNMIRCGDSEI